MVPYALDWTSNAWVDQVKDLRLPFRITPTQYVEFISSMKVKYQFEAYLEYEPFYWLVVTLGLQLKWRIWQMGY